jgi:hypothetical protein
MVGKPLTMFSQQFILDKPIMTEEGMQEQPNPN